MGWHINNTVNTVKFTEKQAEELNPKLHELVDFAHGDFDPNDNYSHAIVAYEGVFQLSFNTDHMEHMDWLTYDASIKDLIAATGVEGDVCFGSEEGDDAGSYWGVRFENGGWVNLVGEIKYVPRQ